jgi:hypothetical protein
MPPMVHPLTRTRRRFLGSAAMTMLAARLGITGSARAMTQKESTMIATATPRYATQDASSTDVRPSTICACASPPAGGPARNSSPIVRRACSWRRSRN